jgi:hypothetical protein
MATTMASFTAYGRKRSLSPPTIFRPLFLGSPPCYSPALTMETRAELYDTSLPGRWDMQG